VTATRLPLARRLAGRVPVRRILWPVPLVLVFVVALRHRTVLAEGFDRLATA
jgi:hypothetical protein